MNKKLKKVIITSAISFLFLNVLTVHALTKNNEKEKDISKTYTVFEDSEENKSIESTVEDINSIKIKIPNNENFSTNNNLDSIVIATSTTPITTTINTTITTTRDTTMSKEILDETDIETNISYVDFDLPYNPNYNGFKAYENYTTITCEPSTAYKLQQVSTTDEDGFRVLDNRYLIAVGTSCEASVGTYIDVILENGTIISCIVGDIKADIHTDSTNTYSLACMCATEFIVDGSITPAKYSGNVSTVYDNWNSNVIRFRVYDKIYELN